MILSTRMPKTVVLIPAFEEEKTITPVLESVNEARQKGIIAHVLVVDDGSADRTRQIAARFGFDTLRIRKNQGKSYAFALGVHRLAKEKPDYVVVLDADLNRFSPDQITRLVSPLIQNPALKMTIGEVTDTHKKPVKTAFSGQRAFTFKALGPLLRQNKKWMNLLGLGLKRGAIYPRMRIGYGLEVALNHLLLPKTPETRLPSDITGIPPRHIASTNFNTQRNVSIGHIRLFHELTRARALTQKRDLLADTLRALRTRKIDPSLKKRFRAKHTAELGIPKIPRLLRKKIGQLRTRRGR